MNILLLGSGGREHALAWKLAQSSRCDRVFAAPGNPGIAEHATLVEVEPADHAAVVAFCREADIGLVVIGPEAPLVDGLADSLRTAGVPVFGPSQAAARLEGSKGFTKDLCAEAGIPTAAYARFDSAQAAMAAIDSFGLPVVIKADGLAAGKGVVIAETRDDAIAALDMMFGGSFGEAGAQVVIEAFLTGEEASFFALTDGDAILAFGSAQDHKRVGEGDTGPNTGGMGAYSPAPIMTAAVEAAVMDRIIRPTVATLAARGTPYSGVLFAGLMLTANGPELIEYNCRFGDPECQVLMMRLESDLVDTLLACATGTLASQPPVQWSDETALTVVMAARGYPGAPVRGGAIRLPETQGGEAIFHAGTARDAQGALVATGGRVLNVTATGANVTAAQKRAYALVDHVDFADGFCRRDIGWREAAREQA